MGFHLPLPPGGNPNFGHPPIRDARNPLWHELEGLWIFGKDGLIKNYAEPFDQEGAASNRWHGAGNLNTDYLHNPTTKWGVGRQHQGSPGFNNRTSSDFHSRTSANWGEKNWSLMAMGVWDSTNAGWQLLGNWGFNGSGGCLVLGQSNGNNWAIYASGSGFTDQAGSNGPPWDGGGMDGRAVPIVAAYDHGSGQLKVAVSQRPVARGSASSPMLASGNGIDLMGGIYGVHYMAAQWGRALTDHEMRSLVDNPNPLKLFYSATDRLYIHTPSAGGPVTLTTEAGAWTAGGADSSLDRTLATEPGSHAWTGALSTLARALLTEPGAWTVAGALSDLVRALSTEPGAWAHSGQDSEFFIGLTLSTEPGTWTHAGIDAPILRGLATEPGAWAWAGQDSDFITGVVLVTEAGTWQLAGAEGLLIRNLDTEAGAHTWAGGDADLFTGIIIETEPGVWTLVGQLSDLPRNFDTEAGTWIQVGRDSSVVIPGQYYLEEAIAMAAQIIFDLRSNTTLTLDAGGANEVTNLRAIRQARSFDPNVGLRFVHSDETEFLIEKETPRDGAGDPIVGDVVLRRGMTLLDETNAESFVIRRIEYDRSGITRIGVVVP